MDDAQHPFFRAGEEPQDEPNPESIGTGEAGGGSSRQRWLRTHVLLVLVVASSAVAIWMMRQHGIKSGMTFQSEDVSFESEYTSDDHKRFERVLAQLEESDRDWQVPLELAGENPFFLGLVQQEAVDNGGADRRAAEAAQRQAEQRRKEIEGALDRLVLQTIITGRMPMATINDQIIRVGEPLEVFTVVEIRTGEVVLEADGERYTITTASHGPGSKPRRRR